jgi:predicted  nucleic acid-binding Zn-ribbon protein
MYVAPTQSIQFKGFTRFLSCNSEGKSRRLSDCPFGTSSFGETRGLTALVKKFSYPNASVEETIGNLHENRTYRVYVAEPNEIVSDMIKLQHDYIVYDYEPEYPDIRENFYAESDNKKGFETMKGYLKRLEAAEIKNAPDSKMVKGILQTLQRKLVVAEECSKIYDEGGVLREQKADYERKIQARRDRIAEIEEALPKYKRVLERHRTTVKNHQDSLAKRETTLRMLEKKKASFLSKGKNVEDMKDLNKRIEYTEQRINGIKNHLERLKKRTDYLEDFIKKAPERLELYRQEISVFTQKLSEITNAVEPYIRRLCEVYAQNGIKIIKRM